MKMKKLFPQNHRPSTSGVPSAQDGGTYQSTALSGATSASRGAKSKGKLHIKNIVAFLLGLAILLGYARPASAQSGVEVTNVNVEYKFGEQVNFSARIHSPIPIQNATVTFRTADGIAQTQPLTVNADGWAGYRYDASLNALPPFSPIVFWFDVALADGTRFTSPNYNFRYADNRFPWQEREEGILRVHWYDGDAAFGGTVLDTARRGLDSARNLISMDARGPIDIYVYANANDLQGALVLGGQSWVAGHASPELGVVMISISPGQNQNIELERQAPHELTHVLLYQSVGPNYNRLPVWLTEGLASLAELNPNPDMDIALAQAAQTNTLLPLADLCASFPPDTGRAFVAYAEAKSFTRFLLDNHGTTGLSALTSAYADGLDCEQGARQALEQPLSQLEVRWRESVLGENRGGVVTTNLFPYLLVLGIILLIPAWGLLGRLRERRQNG